jgi:hypothetical protein
MQTDIIGQVARLPLKPSEGNALLPLFEAISNSMHAITDRFNDENIASRGRIDIEIIRSGDSDSIIGFKVTDNGVGLNDTNYNSFLTPFSQLKINKGGKGIGRLGWLKVFKKVKIKSNYNSERGIESRNFDFILHKDEQIKFFEEPNSSPTEVGTCIILREFIDAYGPKCPIKSATIVQRIIAHFLPIFAGDKSPHILLHDEGEVIDLKEQFSSKILETHEEIVNVEIDEVSYPFIVKHMRCDKSIRPRGGQNNWICFCANDRGVKEYPIDDQIGLKTLGGEEIYVGTITGDFLDSYVNPQRTDFIFDAEDSKEIRRRIATSVRQFLKTYIDFALGQKKALAQNVINKNPQYIYLQGELDSFVQDLKPSSVNEEAIFLEMSQHRFRRQKKFNNVSNEINKSDVLTAAIADKVEEYKTYIVDDQKGALAEYVAKRKAVLDLLDKLSGFDSPAQEKHHLEEAVHSLLCPMRVDSHKLHIEDHNLWILDDRLAFYSFFASDRPISQISDATSGRKPDLAFFYDSCIAWRESDRACDTVILVEFKRPGLEVYTDKNDPFMQLMDCITQFKSSRTVKDRSGKVITGIGPRTSFHCYIVADLTEGLRKRLRGRFDPTPDSRGLFGYTREPDAYVEVIPYEKLIGDAQARNAIFFEKLGLSC